MELLNRFSVYPAIVVQEKLTASDINSDHDVGTRDSFWLVDSALERVKLLNDKWYHYRSNLLLSLSYLKYHISD